MNGGQARSGVHATAVVFREAGILIRGLSGSGKSSLAIALLELADARKCYGALVSDDRVVLLRTPAKRLEARCVANIEGLIEHRGIGIFPVRHTDCALIRLVVDLTSRDRPLPRTGASEERSAEIAGIVLPQLTIGGVASSIERAYAVIEELDRRVCGPPWPIANFA